MKLYTFEKIAGIQPSKDYLRNPKYQFEKIAAGGIASSLTRTPFKPSIKKLPDYMQNQLNNMPDPSVDRQPLTDGPVATPSVATPAPYTLTAEEQRLASANTQRPTSPATSSPMSSNQTPGLPNNSTGYTPIYPPGMPPLTLTNDTALPFNTGSMPYPMQQNQTPSSLSGPNVLSGYNFSTPGPVYTSADGRSQSNISETNVRDNQQYIQNGINSLIESYNKMDDQGKRGFMGLTSLPQGSPYNSVLPYAQEEIRRRGLYPGGGATFTGGTMENIPYGSDGGDSELAFYNDRRLHAKTPESREFAAQQYGKMLQDMNADRLIYRQGQGRARQQQALQQWGNLSRKELEGMGFNNPQDWYSKTPEQRREWFKQRQDNRLANTRQNLQGQWHSAQGNMTDMEGYQRYADTQKKLWGDRWRARGKTDEEIDKYLQTSYKNKLNNMGVDTSPRTYAVMTPLSQKHVIPQNKVERELPTPETPRDIMGPFDVVSQTGKKIAPKVMPIVKGIIGGIRGGIAKIQGGSKPPATAQQPTSPVAPAGGGTPASPAASGASTSAPSVPRELK